ncbi:hypothetical protein FS749_013790 [Ceratobasidium sp. UAMH 11750]|nr:hypothetical protein FS749_013790 [Ceratobasidium sp. UAMH 11750]
MSRFHFYAPYIKTLSVPSPHMMTETHNWEPLVAYSKDNELFPNLVEFFCAEFHPQALSVFLPHSTRKVTIESPRYPKQLDMADTRQNLEHIARQCPGLYTLEFHPESNMTADDLMSMHVLSSFKNLGHLVSTPIILHSAALRVVAQLPSLQTLSIGSTWSSGDWDSSLCEQIPVGGFPALSNLTLQLKKPQDAKRFWELIPLGVLKKLVLTLDGPDKFEFIPTLCRKSPRITDLVIKFGESKEYRGQVYNMSADVFEHLARLPIESCSFEQTELDFEGAWVRVAGAWQNAKSIEFLDQPTSLEDLFVLSSSLPHLKSIGCKFDLAHAAFTVGPNWSPVGQPPFHSEPLNLTSSQAHLMKIAYGPELTGLARYFAYFWPKLSIKSVEEYVSDDPDRDDPNILAELLARHNALFGVFNQLILAHEPAMGFWSTVRPPMSMEVKLIPQNPGCYGASFVVTVYIGATSGHFDDPGQYVNNADMLQNIPPSSA